MVLLAMVNRIALADRNQESKRHKFSWWWWSQFESNMKFILILHHYICAYRYNGYSSPFAKEEKTEDYLQPTEDSSQVRSNHEDDARWSIATTRQVIPGAHGNEWW